MANQVARDSYGGCFDVTFGDTGFFRLEKADRWWLVTPAGHAFLSFGLNHVQPSLMLRPENQAHWMAALGVNECDGREAFLLKYRERVEEDLRAFGFNTLGCHSGTQHYSRSFLPYVHTLRFVDICHHMSPVESDFPDVFAPEFERLCDRKARVEAGPRKDDPYLLGYSFTDCPILTELDAAERGVVIYGAPRRATATWPRVLRNLGADAPGKGAYVDLVRQLYADDVRGFNQAYATAFESFDALGSARDWRPAADPRNPHEHRDNARFLERIVDRYYTVAVAALRRYDPNHLVFGDKLNGNTGVPDGIVDVVARHVDLVFYQFYGHYGIQHPVLEDWSRRTGIPLLNGDSSFSVPDDMMPCPLGPHCRHQTARAEVSLDFSRRAFARPDFVGWHWCGWMDGWKTIPGKELRQHSGLQDPFGNRYAPMVKALSTISQEMYSIAISCRHRGGAAWRYLAEDCCSPMEKPKRRSLCRG